MYAQAQPRDQRTNSPAPTTPGSSTTQDHAQAQRARAARCAVNNSAPGRHPATTAPRRKSSEWRPGPTRLINCTLTAPRPRANISSPALVHPSVRPRELASPAQSPAQGDGGLQHSPGRAQEEHDGAHSERRGPVWRPMQSDPLASYQRPQGRTAAARPRYTRRGDPANS